MDLIEDITTSEDGTGNEHIVAPNMWYYEFNVGQVTFYPPHGAPTKPWLLGNTL